MQFSYTQKRKELAPNWRMKNSLKIVSQNFTQPLGSKVGVPEELSIDRRDDFLAMINHELRTPLASLMGALGLLKFQQAGKTDPDTDELIDLADRSGRRLERLVDDFLDFTQIEGNRLFMNLEHVDLFDLLIDTVKICEGHRPDLKLVLDTQLDSRHRMAKVDRHRFGQVINNLLTNAIKFSQTKKSVYITLECVNPNDVAILDVKIRDEGPGISSEDLVKMFERLSPVRTPSATTSLSSHGLGLYITKGLVGAMKGELSIASELGLGTEITVSFIQVLPLAETSSHVSQKEIPSHA